MFCRERHKSEYHQYDIADLKKRNLEIAQDQESKAKKKQLAAGIFILPTKHKQKDDYERKRPDYPESPPPLALPVGKLVEVLDNESSDVEYKDGILEIDSNSQYHSEV